MSYYAYRDATKLGPYRVDPGDHYGLAMGIARDFSCPHLERADIEQEALVALCVAARTFDPDRGVKFCTWAGKLIRSHLSGVVYLYRRVGVVGGVNHRILSRGLRQHLRSGGSTHAGIVRELLRESPYWANPTDWDCFVVVRSYLHREDSLDDTLGGDWESSPGASVPRHETVEDPSLLQDIEDGARAGEIERAVGGALRKLRPREREIAVLRVLPDLLGDDAPTLQEVADKWGVTRQRAQQVEADAMAKLQRMLSRA